MFDDDEEEGFYEDGRLNEDIELFQKYLETGENYGFLDSDRWEAMLDHFVMQGQYTAAVRCAEEASNQFGFNHHFKIRKAQALSAVGKLKEAVNLLTEVERSGGANFELLLTKAAVFSQLKDSKNAIKYFTAALNEAPSEDKDEVYLDLAMEYENKSDYKSALKILKQAIKYNSKNEGAIYEAAFCYDQLGEFDKSIQCYLDFIDENPYSFTAWYNLGNAFLRVDNYAKAIWAYDYCILINDDFGPVYYNLAHAYLADESYKLAIDNFQKSMDLDGDDPIALSYLGECFEQLGQLENAREKYKKALDLSPMLPDAWLGLGIVEDLEGNTQEAITLIKKAMELDPENAGIYHVLAGAYEKLEEVDAAIENYELSLTYDPTDEECLRNYMNLLKVEGFQRALNFLEDFEKTTPQNTLLNTLKVHLLWRVGRESESLLLFAECLQGDRDKALELFEIDPALKNVQEFVLLADQ
jgi:tetratricopeptide (TPR) repeat protein